MRKRNIFVLLFALLAIILLTVSVSADQDGNDYWCNSDQYGCWVTNEDGGKCYIMFWSEEARKYFMGPVSDATVCEPVDSGSKQPLEPAPKEKRPMEKAGSSGTWTWLNDGENLEAGKKKSPVTFTPEESQPSVPNSDQKDISSQDQVNDVPNQIIEDDIQKADEDNTIQEVNAAFQLEN